MSAVKRYLAPMEGITTYVYRNARRQYTALWISISPLFWSPMKSAASKNGSSRKFCRRITEGSLWCLRS